MQAPLGQEVDPVIYDADQAGADHQGEHVHLAKPQQHRQYPPGEADGDGQQGDPERPQRAKRQPHQQQDPDRGAEPYGGDVLLGQLAGMLAVEEGATAQQFHARKLGFEALLRLVEPAQQLAVAGKIEGRQVQLGAQQVPLPSGLVPADQPAVIEAQGAGHLSLHRGPGQQQGIGLPLGAGDAAKGAVDLAEHPLAPDLWPRGQPRPAALVEALPAIVIDEALPGGGQLRLGGAHRAELGQGLQVVCPRLRRGLAILPRRQAQHPDQLPVDLAQQALTQGGIQRGALLVRQQIHQAGVDAAVGELPTEQRQRQRAEQQPEPGEPAPGGFSLQQEGLSSSRRGRRAGASSC